MKNMSSKFIVFEGLDGSGKSTQIKLLHEFLNSKNIANQSIREPGSTQSGEMIRNILKTQDLEPLTELLLFNAARAQLLHETINKNHQQWILCDRYTYSTWAYQHYGRGMSKKTLETLDSLQSIRKPDIVFLFNHPVQNQQPRDSFEKINKEKIINGYKSLHIDNLVEIPLLDITATSEYIIKQIERIFKINFDI